MNIDIGDLCTHCGKDTSLGSGELLFVNRIPSGADGKLVLAGGEEVTIDVDIDGYMCVNCQLIQCDMCGGMVLEWRREEEDCFGGKGMSNGDVVCEDCFGKEEKEGGKE